MSCLNVGDSVNSRLTSPAVFFGHLTPAVEDLRYQHMYHPVPVEQKSPALAEVLKEISAGRFGDHTVYEPFVNRPWALTSFRNVLVDSWIPSGVMITT